MHDFPCNDAGLMIPGPAGDLEAATLCPAQPAGATAVICHPHPLHGGTMHNKVVHTLARGFSELGLRTVRFNFRGVGRSAGTYASAIGETDDALSVVDWVRQYRPQDELWLAGFSFGAYVALRTAARTRVKCLTLVAPPVHLYRELGAPPAPTVPTLVLQGDADEVVPADAVRAWATALTPSPRIVDFPGVGHYFHGKLNDLRAAVQQQWADAIPHGR